MNPDSIRCATGELGRNPKVFIWETLTMKKLCCLKGYLINGV